MGLVLSNTPPHPILHSNTKKPCYSLLTYWQLKKNIIIASLEFSTCMFSSLYSSLYYVLCLDFTSSSTTVKTKFTNTESFNSCKWDNWFLILFFPTQKPFCRIVWRRIYDGLWLEANEVAYKASLLCDNIEKNSGSIKQDACFCGRNSKKLFTHPAIISQSDDCAWR